MKVLLLNTPSRKRPVIRDMAGGIGFDGGDAIRLPPLDLLYFGATLLDKGHTVRVIDADAENMTDEQVITKACEFSPDIIIATVSLPTIYNDTAFLKKLKTTLNPAKVIAKTGIKYPQILKEMLELSCADLVIYGECDTIVDKIIENQCYEGTARIIDGQLMVEQEDLLVNLDRIPIPARHLINNNRYFYNLLGKPVATMQTSRGCPFPCAYYCPYPLVQGSHWRARSPKHVFAEIEDIVERYKISKILFRDATFTLDRKRAEMICNFIIEKNLKVSWWCETRINCIDSNLLLLMKQAGLKGMNVGVETGDPEVMKEQAKAGVTFNKLIDLRESAKKIGVRLHFLLMVGLPGESKSSLYETYKLVGKLRPESIGVTIVTPYPGTPLYEEAKKKGWIETANWKNFGGHQGVMHTDKLTRRSLIFTRNIIELEQIMLQQGNRLGALGAKLLQGIFYLWANL